MDLQNASDRQKKKIKSPVPNCASLQSGVPLAVHKRATCQNDMFKLTCFRDTIGNSTVEDISKERAY